MNEPQTIIVSSDCTCVKYVAVQSRKFSYSFISNHLKRNFIIPIGRATTKDNNIIIVVVVFNSKRIILF